MTNTTTRTAANMTPKELHRELDRYVVGQTAAKQALSVAVYNHCKRLRDRTGLIRKSNILLAGPSGTGKTLLAKTIASFLNVPFVTADATSLTEAGYTGEDVDTILQRLLREANGDLSRAQYGVVFLDEVDKIARKRENGGRDVSGEGVQTSLLKLVEGASISIRTDNGDYVTFETDNVLFIAAGAFDGMIRSGKINPESLVRFGMMREFIGRFPCLVELEALTEDDLVHILTEPKDALTKEYKQLFAMDGVQLVFEDVFLRGLAKRALERGVGARGLRALMEELLLMTMYRLPDWRKDNIVRVTLVEKTLEDGSVLAGRRVTKKKETVTDKAS